MRVLYIARHGGYDNDDEGAIAHCLAELGCEVECLHEDYIAEAAEEARLARTDLILLHKLADYSAMQRIRSIRLAGGPSPLTAFWFFDLVESKDWDLVARTRMRTAWMVRMIPAVDIGFMTDGDFVSRDTSGKLHHLMQGADGRRVGPAPVDPHRGQDIDLLFTGTTVHGGKRASHVERIRQVWGDRFTLFGYGNKERAHGRELAALIARAKIVVAPDGPVTDLYWSNRVYQGLGFGAFMLHPYCGLLAEHYEDGEEIVFYHDRDEFDELARRYLADEEARRRIANAGYLRTLSQHTYKHRCIKLLDEIEVLTGRMRRRSPQPVPRS